MSAFLESLYEPSWRGLPFAALDTGGKFGRATAVHDYPFRDDIWVEDLGRATRRHGIRGFLVGDDVADQLQAMIEACEQPGSGTLVHPLLGPLQVCLVDFEPTTRHDLGRVVELVFSFIEGGDEPAATIDTDFGGLIGGLADDLDFSAAGDFSRTAGDALRQGSDVVRAATAQARGWIGIARGLAGNARSVLSSVAGIVPGFDKTVGRILGRGGVLGTVDRALGTASGAVGSVSSIMNRIGSAQRAVARGSDTVVDLASRL